MHNLFGEDHRLLDSDAVSTLLPQAVSEAMDGEEDELSDLPGFVLREK